MIRCTKCDTINTSDAILCVSCSSLLQWTGVPVDPSELEPDPAAEAKAADEARLAAEASAAAEAEATARAAAAEDARLAAETSAVAEAKAAEDARLAAEREAAEQARQASEAKAADEARMAAEAKAVEEAQLAEERAVEEARSSAAAHAAEARIAAEAKAADDARLAADAGAADEARRATEAQAAEDARIAAEAKAADDARIAAEQAAAEQARLAAEQAAAEQARLAAEAAEEARVAAEAKAAEEARVAAEAKAAEEARVAAEQAAVEQARLAAEAKAAEDARIAAEAKAAEDARIAAEAKAAAERARQAADAEFRAAELARVASDASDVEEDQPPAIRPGQRPDEPPMRRPLTTGPAEDEQPDARKPTLDIPAHPRLQPDPPPQPEPLQAAPGDVICRVCRTPNTPSRTFCRKCGSSLAAEAPPPANMPWYRRIFVREPRTKQAGERPKRLGEAGQPRPGPLRRAIPFVLIGVLAFGATSLIVSPAVRDALGGAIIDLRLRFLPEISDVHPVTVQGAGVRSNVGRLAIDNNTATFWLADPAAGDPTVTAGLASTINLGGLVVHSGSTTEAAFTSHRRPKTLELTFPGTSRPAVEVTLKDIAEPQPVAIDVRGIKTVAFRVVDFFEAAAGGDKLVAIREIELKERR